MHPTATPKKFSIQLLAGEGRFKVTPIYDVMSAYPVMGNRPNQWADQEIELAMALFGKNRHYLARGIQRRHVNSTAKKVGYGDSAEPLLQNFTVRTPAIAERVRNLPDGYSEKVADKILGGLLDAAKTLERMGPANRGVFRFATELKTLKREHVAYGRIPYNGLSHGRIAHPAVMHTTCSDPLQMLPGYHGSG